MGWNGGAPLFDGIVELVLEYVEDPTPATIQSVVDDAYALFEDTDWDTEDESRFFDDYLIHTMYDLGRIDQDEYAEHLDESI